MQQKNFVLENVGRVWLTGGLCGLEGERRGQVERGAGDVFTVFTDNTSRKPVLLLFATMK